MKIYTTNTEAYVSFERSESSGYYLVKLYDNSGNLVDKAMCDDYNNACDYRKSFVKIAKSYK